MRIKKLSATEKKVLELLEPVVNQAGFELVTVEFQGGRSGMVLRLFIDREEGGVTLDDCASISRTAGDILDIHDIIAERYNLEVSSPGVNRILVTDDDLRKYTGQKVRIRAKQLLDGRKRFNGLLKGVVDNAAAVQIDNEIFKIPLEHISRARLDII
jgi:ribosome maturation factor RimP